MKKVIFHHDPWYLTFPEEAEGPQKGKIVLLMDESIFNEFLEWEERGGWFQEYFRNIINNSKDKFIGTDNESQKILNVSAPPSTT